MKNLALTGCALALTLSFVPGCGGDDGPYEDAGNGSPDGSDDTGPSTSGPDATPGKPDASKTPDAGSDATTPPVDASTDATTPLDVNVPADTGSGSDGTVSANDAGDAGTDSSSASSPDAGEDAGTTAPLPAAVAIWEFQDAPGSTIAIDSSGNGHNAMLMGTAAIVGTAVPADAGADASPDGGTSEAGSSEAGASEAGGSEAGADDSGAPDAGAPSALAMYGNYLQIDGTANAFADVTGGPLFDNSKSFTVSAWVYFPSFDYNYDELISADGDHASVFELQLAPTSGGASYNAEAAFPTQDVPEPGAFYYAFSTNQPSLATWYHIVGVYSLGTNPGLLSLYVNGVLQSNVADSTSTGANPVAAVGDFIIGAGKYNNVRTTGAVANYVGVRVYAEALSAAQVGTLYSLNGR